MEGNETLLFEKGDGIELTCKVRLVLFIFFKVFKSILKSL